MRRRIRVGAVAAASTWLLGLPLASSPALAGVTTPGPIPHALSLSTTGSNGIGTSVLDALPCPGAPSPSTSYWHYGYDATLAPGGFGPEPADLRLYLDVRDDQNGGAVPNGWLEGTESTVTIANPRGSVVVRLTDGGSCGNRTATVSGDAVATSGTWTVGAGSGAYSRATGAGTFSVQAGLAPGATNPWTLSLNGTINVARPTLVTSVVRTYWGQDGLDYLSRTVSVVYQLADFGGNAYDVRLAGFSSGDPGVSYAGGAPTAGWDIGSGSSVQFVARWRVAATSGCPTGLGCNFRTTIHASLHDGLDASLSYVTSVSQTTPAAP